MRDEPERVREVALQHASYWRGLGLHDYLGGPFADRSGGLITFEAGSGEEALELVANDPFVRAGLLESRWLKEWDVERIAGSAEQAQSVRHAAGVQGQTPLWAAAP